MARNKLVLLMMMMMLSTGLFAQAGKVKAGYLYQFTKYVEWPVSMKSGEFVIGVLGNTDAVSSLNELAAVKKVVEQPIVVKEYKSVAEIGKCHILFVTEAQSGNLTGVMSKVGSNGTLIVGENQGMAQKGAEINFVIKEGKVVFEVNQSSFKQHGLSVNSQLLDLAVNKY